MRNFSLPRERCLDTLPASNERELHIPRIHVATGLASSDQVQLRRLPSPPTSDEDTSIDSAHGQIIQEFVVQPLDLRKIHRRKSQLLLEPTVKECRFNTRPMKLAVEIVSGITFFPALASEVEHDPVTSINSPSMRPGHDIKTDDAGELAELLIEESLVHHGAPQPSEPLTSHAVEIQQPAPTIPAAAECSKALEVPDTTSPEPSTIRLVDSVEKLPHKPDHGSLGRKWAGQPAFLSV